MPVPRQAYLLHLLPGSMMWLILQLGAYCWSEPESFASEMESKMQNQTLK
jgi:hypothetical protein